MSGTTDGHRAARSWSRARGTWLLAVTVATCYLYDLPVNGFGNEYYAAASWAGTRDLTALAFGSLDPGNVVSVDKPPLGVLLPALSARLLGFSSWSVLAPQALMGVAAALAVHATARRVAGPAAALLAGTIMAATPVSAMMFRHNNPDALTVLAMTVGTWCTVRAARTASTPWLLAAGAATGAGFLAKMLGAFLHLPALVVLYLLCAPATLRRRLTQLASALGVLLVSAGWFPVLVELWPRHRRPYVGGSSDDSLLQLAWGYNGMTRMAGGARRAFGSRPGPWRLFHGEFGIEISWLLPAAVVAVVAILHLRRSRPRPDLVRGLAVMSAVWLATGWVTLSFMRGPTHAYYSLAMVPPVALVVPLAAHEVGRARHELAGRVHAAALVLTSAWAVRLLWHHERGWASWLGWLVLAAGAGALLGLAAAGSRPVLWRPTLVLGLVALLATPLAYSLAGLTRSHQGPSPSARPADPPRTGSPAAPRPAPRPPADETPHVVALLAGAGDDWAAAVPGAQEAARLQIAARVPVMAVGGYLGTDPAPTLQDFRALVRAGRVRYYLARPRTTAPRRRSRLPSARIDAWVRATCPARVLDGLLLHDLHTCQGR
ncbi:glycosyltransferase family 39 protein [Arsenicicoccus dermatophilus]|uniref:glycosyltransferase family 39 protein n=1 Tax=Arsenicicoccus dermatophilus TaxID=1076331 RepID=UPI003916D602